MQWDWKKCDIAGYKYFCAGILKYMNEQNTTCTKYWYKIDEWKLYFGQHLKKKNGIFCARHEIHSYRYDPLRNISHKSKSLTSEQAIQQRK